MRAFWGNGPTLSTGTNYVPSATAGVGENGCPFVAQYTLVGDAFSCNAGLPGQYDVTTTFNAPTIMTIEQIL